MMSLNNLREKFKSRELLFGAWISYAHPSITENFAEHAFDFTVIDMEHSTISLEQAQRIIAAMVKNRRVRPIAEASKNHPKFNCITPAPMVKIL